MNLPYLKRKRMFLSMDQTYLDNVTKVQLNQFFKHFCTLIDIDCYYHSLFLTDDDEIYGCDWISLACYQNKIQISEEKSLTKILVTK